MSAQGVSDGAILDALGGADDSVAAFQIEGEPVRGRIARLDAALDDILTAHAYPGPVARLLGEAVIVAALVGNGLKFDGRLTLQCSSDGPVSLLVVDYFTDGGVRGYARVRRDGRDEIAPDAAARDLLGDGTVALTIDPADEHMERYQGLAPLEGDSLAEAVEGYFRQSEQIPTRLRVAVGRLQKGDEPPRWRGGGMLIQQVAGDDSRGDSNDAWTTARAHFETLTDHELLDPDLSGGRLLFRLFHESGARLFDPLTVRRVCQCSAARVQSVLGGFPAAEREEMTQDGAIVVTCEYCNTAYRFTAEDFPA